MSALNLLLPVCLAIPLAVLTTRATASPEPPGAQVPIVVEQGPR